MSNFFCFPTGNVSRATLRAMPKIAVLTTPPKLPDPDLEGFDPPAGTSRVRFAAFTRVRGLIDLSVLRSVVAGVWAPVAALRIDGGGKVAHVDVPVEDEREAFVVVADGGSVPSDLEVHAEALIPPERKGDCCRRDVDGGYAAEILEDVRRHLPPTVGEMLPLPDAVRSLAEEVRGLRLVDRTARDLTELPARATAEEVAEALKLLPERPAEKPPAAPPGPPPPPPPPPPGA